ncbi:MAG: RHS repeat-associated core domain-containing protein, partial [Planctomycetes bacterium]|nr:RHS repeat-associated core domain-containing protein [Planctomycetota bacterium]
HPVASSSYGLPFLWKSIRLDEITGLLQMRNRYYSTELGRFLTRDPLGEWGDGANLGNAYAYAGGRQLVWGDPMGLQSATPPVAPGGLSGTGGKTLRYEEDADADGQADGAFIQMSAVWVEGRGTGEPGLHQSLAVGDPYGKYIAFSFGAVGIGSHLVNGEVYIDKVSGGCIQKDRFIWISPELAARAAKLLGALVGQSHTYGPATTCRWWSQTQFDLIKADLAEHGLSTSGFGAPDRSTPGPSGGAISTTTSTTSPTTTSPESGITTTTATARPSVAVSTTTSSTTSVESSGTLQPPGGK